MTCSTCEAALAAGAVYCGVCGGRARARQASREGMMVDGRYRIEGKLAAGGFGAIYRAIHVPTGAAVALKVLHPDLASDPHLSARFRREGAALSRLRDPHTVATFDVGESDDGTLYIAMELLEGRTLLAELHRRGPLPWRRMLAIMRGMCSALVEAHALGIVHRDVKPANIHLEDRPGEPDFVKLLDFGIAKLLGGSGVDDGGSDLTRVGQAIGTLEYMSPEQLIGGETDARSDLYSLGVVAYEMITGRRPFADATGPTALVTALMTRAPAAPSAVHPRGGIPAEVDALLLRCLARDPQARFASAAELAAAIDAALARPEPPARAVAEAPGPATTLPGSGPYRMPRMSAVTLRGAGSAGPASAVLDDGDITVVDARPLFDPLAWEPGPPTTPEPLQVRPLPPMIARAPLLAVRPRMPDYSARAEGSSVGPAPAPRPARPAQLAPAVREAPRLPRGAVELAIWTAVLLASGVGLGLVVAALS